MTFFLGWQNIILSAVIFIAFGLLLYSIRQLFKLRRLQQDNINITWLIVLSIIVVFVSIYFLYIALTQASGIALLLNACLVLISVLVVWFATRAGNSIAADLTKSAALEHYYATHDDLTGLPNLFFFNEQLEQILDQAQSENHDVALLLIDLKRFKVINETLGHFVGDAMLQEIAQRIRSSLRKTDLIARLGGDEFAVLINPVVAQGHIHTISKNIADSIQEPLAVEGKPADVGVVIGVSVFPKHANNSYELIEKARISMIEAEKQGDTILVYDPATSSGAAEDIQIVGMLQRAIQEEQLVILYQPQVRLSDEEIISAEALIRWQHPNYGLLDPSHFIPYAERAGLIYEINLWLLRNVVQLLTNWRDKGIHISIAMNITANGFLNKEFQHELNTLLKNHSWLAEKLKIELTETSRIDHIDAIQESMFNYKKRGLRFSLDDYGTKHASLEYLKRLPFDELKIDQSFMVNAANDEDSRAIIQHAKEIAQQLKLTSTAEGIENQEVLDIAKTYGIDTGQGYYFGGAVEAEEIEGRLGLVT